MRLNNGFLVRATAVEHGKFKMPHSSSSLMKTLFLYISILRNFLYWLFSQAKINQRYSKLEDSVDNTPSIFFQNICNLKIELVEIPRYVVKLLQRRLIGLYDKKKLVNVDTP